MLIGLLVKDTSAISKHVDCKYVSVDWQSGEQVNDKVRLFRLSSGGEDLFRHLIMVPQCHHSCFISFISLIFLILSGFLISLNFLLFRPRPA